jgi:hypothetical protein
VYKFRIRQGMLQFEDYKQRDLEADPVEAGEIHGKVWEWTETEGGLILGVESMTPTTYFRAPLRREQLKQAESGRINNLQITLGDLGFQNSRLFLENTGLIKRAKVIIRRTSPDLDLTQASSYRVIFRGCVTAVSAEAGAISLEVSERYHDWSRPLSKREYSKVCNFVFKGSRCGYSGEETRCDKTLTRCQELGNQDNFGGFPELPDLQFRGF